MASNSEASPKREAPSTLPAALKYARSFDWEVFPAPPGKKKSYKSGRYNGNTRWGATKDPSEIQADWHRWPNANVGIPTGAKNGIFVVEVDTIAAHSVDGESSLKALIDGREWPRTLIAISPSGSRHHYFKWPSTGLVVRNSASELGPGIDVRGEGGMCVAPPSRRGEGQYRWESEDTPIADAPEWLLELIATHQHRELPTAENHEPVDLAEIKLVMRFVAPTVPPGHQKRFEIGAALNHETRGSIGPVPAKCAWPGWVASAPAVGPKFISKLRAMAVPNFVSVVPKKTVACRYFQRDTER